MAVSIVTGGIAIANGIMAAGQAGVGKAVAEFATNMSMESGGKLVSTVIEGGKDFIGGVAEGLMNPMKSDAGQALSGGLDAAKDAVFGSATGEAVRGADMTAQGVSAAESSAADAVTAGVDAGGVGTGSIPPPEGIPQSLASQKAADPAYSTAGFSGGEAPPTGIPDAMAGGAPESLLAESMPASYNNAGGLPTEQMGGMGGFMESEGMALPSSGGFSPPTAAPVAAAPEGILGQMKSAAGSVGGKAGEYFGSPGGMKTLADMVSGWAQGAQRQKMIDDFKKEEKRRVKSWETYSQPRFGRG